MVPYSCFTSPLHIDVSWNYLWNRLCANLVASVVSLCDPMECSPPGSSVHGILQARILEWVVMPSSRGSSPTQGSNLHLLSFVLAARFFTTSTIWEAPWNRLLEFKFLSQALRPWLMGSAKIYLYGQFTQGSCTHSHSHLRAPISQQYWQLLDSSHSFIVLFCVSVITRETWYFFIHLWATWCSYLWISHLSSFPFSIGLPIFFLIWIISLYILDISSLVLDVANIFSQSVKYLLNSWHKSIYMMSFVDC